MYIIYDAEQGEVHFAKTLEKAKICANEWIQEYLEDGIWSTVPHVYIAPITHETTEIKVSTRPNDSELDGEGYAKDGYNYDNDYDGYYNYVLKEVTS